MLYYTVIALRNLAPAARAGCQRNVRAYSVFLISRARIGVNFF